ncbi:MAG TPA: 2-octaprenyl-6-methoxyphenyl hydroxylase [Gammaproteobacteria bacterium]|nr:2-octaprenyl-6-methoxyphenyl hydroxylase [Gammaproteobacteria bacterium]
MSTDYDIVIVGSGLVGTSLAVALAATRHRVALVDRRAFKQDDDTVEQPYDERSLALGYGSKKIYQGIGVWETLKAGAAAIDRVHVSEQGRLGVTRLNSQDFGLPALGYVVTVRHLAATLAAAMEAQENLSLLMPATLQTLDTGPDCVTLQLDRAGQSKTISTRLMVATDGANSVARTLLGIDTQASNYHQQAVIANITPEKAHHFEAFERFTLNGPIALLPIDEKRCSLVWTHTPEGAEQVMQLSDDDFLSRLQQHFGYRLGRLIKVGKRAVYPLKLVLADRLIAPRSVVMGNAAHTLHPIAGQGLNLALRDVALLAEQVANREDPGEWAGLWGYADVRMPDIQATARATDGLLRLFTQPLPWLAHARGAGLIAMDRLPWVKARVARFGMGFRDELQGDLFQGHQGEIPL